MDGQGGGTETNQGGPELRDTEEKRGETDTLRQRIFKYLLEASLMFSTGSASYSILKTT